MLLATAQPMSFDFLTGPRTDTPAGLPAVARRAVARVSAGDAPWADRRDRVRRPHFVAAHLSRAGGAESAVAYTRDVSATSVGLVGRVEWMVGAKLSLRLASPGGEIVAAAARVRRCRSVDNGWFDLHAEFMLPQHALGQL